MFSLVGVVGVPASTDRNLLRYRKWCPIVLLRCRLWSSTVMCFLRITVWEMRNTNLDTVFIQYHEPCTTISNQERYHSNKESNVISCSQEIKCGIIVSIKLIQYDTRYESTWNQYHFRTNAIGYIDFWAIYIKYRRIYKKQCNEENQIMQYSRVFNW